MARRALVIVVPLEAIRPASITEHHHSCNYVVPSDPHAVARHQPILTAVALHARIYANLTLGHLSGQSNGRQDAGHIDFARAYDNSTQTLEEQLILWLSRSGPGRAQHLTLTHLISLAKTMALPFQYGRDVL